MIVWQIFLIEFLEEGAKQGMVLICHFAMPLPKAIFFVNVI
jgi:hypothetical protein